MAQKVLTWSNSQGESMQFSRLMFINSPCTCIRVRIRSGIKDVTFVLFTYVENGRSY